MNKKIGIGFLSMALLLLVAFTAACSDDAGKPSPSLTAASVGQAAVASNSSVSNQVVLGDGPAGIAGSRFTDPDVVVNLTAEVFQWEVIEGEMIEVWGYNGQYPGPEIRAKVGDKVRITLTNDLPEATTIHWHGLEIPNDQDGVPGITQPDVQPGESWTYEFIAPKPGTSMYHTHSNTVQQLQKGLFGAFIIEPVEGLPQYDRQYTLLLHETSGFYTVNGNSFPKTLDESPLKIKEGERILIRMINVGQQHHPMHLHGHQFKVVQLDGSPLESPLLVNTQDLAPGQTADVEIMGNNPGTWVFHCHVLFHVMNKGQYPGGMLLTLDYEDHTSYLEANSAVE
ncbi:multicopper oxidase domain-containing protein [Dehalococcoides mccartyi]|nr:multicopper oxidase domain-containing protein [Dehalococcoides mccartyi]